MHEVSEALGADLAVMADLPGPKIRLGDLATEPLRLEPGASFVLRPGGGAGDAAGRHQAWRVTSIGCCCPTARSSSPSSRPGGRGRYARGAGRPDPVGAGVNVPAERLGLPALTDRDRAGLEVALAAGVDLVAQSFVRSAPDVLALREAMGDRTAPIVAKIETRPAVEDFASILEAVDAVMVARGDLGVELPLEEIPVLQKQLVREARRAGTPVIVATQMLESMTHAPRPTRAEASDVANAMLDGTDAIMLSAETAIGEFPIEAASAAVRIAEAAEAWAIETSPARRERGVATDEAVSLPGPPPTSPMATSTWSRSRASPRRAAPRRCSRTSGPPCPSTRSSRMPPSAGRWRCAGASGPFPRTGRPTPTR